MSRRSRKQTGGAAQGERLIQAHAGKSLTNVLSNPGTGPAHSRHSFHHHPNQFPGHRRQRAAVPASNPVVCPARPPERPARSRHQSAREQRSEDEIPDANGWDCTSARRPCPQELFFRPVASSSRTWFSTPGGRL